MVNAVAPGSIDTELAKTMDPVVRAKIREAIPLGRLGHPDEVADCVLFLASSRADYITGATIDVNGGSLMSQ
jgi:3-oxoacyl-[acyl-carrier protein] reductase